MRAFAAVALGETPGAHDPASSSDHLTLHFLGEIEDRVVPRLRETLAPAVGAHRAFPLVVEGVGAFPDAQRPRVVWRGVGLGRDELTRLAGDVRRADVAAGLPDDLRPFRPHLTLFRVRSPRDAARARDLLDGRTPAPPPTPCNVTEVLLVESRLRPGGAEHRTIARFPLAPRG